MNAVQEYLRLSSAYCQFLGGLRWSSSDDTVVYPDGRTFAFNEEIAAFLAGFGRQRPLMHFGHVLHLLDLLRNSRELPAREVVRLRHAFAEADASIANAGAFFASVCRAVPDIPLAVDVKDVCDRLCHPAMPIRWFIVSFHDTFHPTQAAPLEPETFEARMLRAVAAYSDEELRHWFRHGQGAVKDVGGELARQLPVPRTLLGVLAALLERPRLAGAQAFVAQLVSALTLPPRRLTHQELPVGGYADVTTHGPVEQILPSQFALDKWDFFRRFADHELLYYRREEPQARTRQDLVVLLDQGVRTWGDVRLVLGAAALAFGKQAARRKTPFYLAATGGQGALIDPLQTDVEDLGRLVEASDLSANPGLALEAVLEQPAAGARDVVLLTHPRNLREPDVRAAARRLARGVRLFAVAMDAAGCVDLVEMRHGAPVPVRQFKVARPPAPPLPRPKLTDYPGELAPWRGDVEPIGFPFRFGVASPIVSFDFDYTGEWLLTATRDGLLHAYRTSGGDWEILPRGMWQNRPLARPDTVLGVRGGFVIGGYIDRQPLAFHYDFNGRTSKAFMLSEPRSGPVVIYYSREHHAVLVHPKSGKPVTIPLATGATGSLQQPFPLSRAAADAMWKNYFANTNPPTEELCVVRNPSMYHNGRASRYIDLESGEVRLQGLLGWERFTPIADGLPALRGWIPGAFQCRQQTLALLTTRRAPDAENVLRLFRGPVGIPLATYPMRAPRPEFTLSDDGERIARLVGNKVMVNRVGRDNGLILRTRAGGHSNRFRLVLGEGWLFLATSKNYRHLVRWDRAELELSCWNNKQAAVNQDAYYFLRTPDPTRVEAVAEGVPAGYDHERFVMSASTNVLAVADRFGQVAIFDVDDRLICMFFAFRERLAAWMPDGTRYGAASLTGGPPTPEALAKIGQALRKASERGRARP